VFSAVQPIMFVLLFTYVFGGAIQKPSVEYVDFLIPGIVVWTVAFASFGTGIGLNEDRSKSMVDRFRSLPIARSAYLTGRILADTVRITGNVLLLAGVGVLLGLRFAAGPVPALGGFLLATAFGVAMAWVAALIGLAARSPETVNHIRINEFRSVLDRICAVPAALSPRAPPGPARVTSATDTPSRSVEPVTAPW
jgi:ABC-type polysaccharide/polyol phosphate export permease